MVIELATFSHTGQIHGAFKAFVKEQITQKLIAFEVDPKPSKIRSTMKWWSKRISVVIAKTAIDARREKRSYNCSGLRVCFTVI